MVAVNLNTVSLKILLYKFNALVYLQIKISTGIVQW